MREKRKQAKIYDKIAGNEELYNWVVDSGGPDEFVCIRHQRGDYNMYSRAPV